MNGFRRVLVRVFASVAGVVAGFTTPHVAARILAADAAPLFDGRPEAEREIAIGAGSWGSVGASDFSTGAELFDREWAFGAPMMRTSCLAQVSLRHPDVARDLAASLERSARDVVLLEARAFTRAKWGSDPIAEDVEGHDHTAFLGYGGLALGLALAAGDASSASDHEAVVARLRKRLLGASGRWLETYPGEVYPVDVASAVGAVALAARLEGVDPARDEAVVAGLALVRSAVDPDTGLLLQAIDPGTGAAADGPRGSGTFLASYFLLPADPGLSYSLYQAGRRELAGSALGFAAMRERPASAPGGGDIDSGPIVFGFGVSATGFALAPARAFGDRETFTSLYATASLFGVPSTRDDGGRRYVAGGPLGDAILCAMATAPTPEELASWARGHGA